MPRTHAPGGATARCLPPARPGRPRPRPVTCCSTTSATTSKTASTSKTRQSYADQFNSIMTQIDQMAKDSGYNGINLLMGNSLKTTFNEKTGKLDSRRRCTGEYKNRQIGQGPRTPDVDAKSAGEVGS